MRSILPCLVVLFLTGCTQPATTTLDTGPSAIEPAQAIVPVQLVGTYWLPTATTNAPGSIDIPLNSTNLHLEIKLRLGTRVAGTEAPSSAANAVVKLVDAANTTMGETMLMAPTLEATFFADHAAAGIAHLVFSTHGGSDGASSGDHIDFTLTASVRQA